ncbi:MAG: site-specific integrase [Bacteriovoracaceae bacterium]|nr:site-specific integrase [Bacteriovoracaceae bacterium]
MAIRTYQKNNSKFYEAHAKLVINGKQVNRKKKGITSIAQAKREEIRLRIELIQLRDKPFKPTWNDWSSKCLERIRLEFKVSTYINYKSNLEKWITPCIGKLYLEDITASDIHELIFNKTNSLGLTSKKTLLKHIKRIFSIAVEDGIIAKNPAKALKVKISESKKLIFNKTEIDTFLESANRINHPYYNHWVLALLTGMRSGELYALQWTDVDFDGGFISINKSWSSKNGFGPTKSTLNRVVPISKELEKFLRLLKSKSLSPTSPILERHKDWESGIQAKIIKKFCLEIGITPIRFHDLRATFITQLLLHGVPVAKVMAIVGHSQLKTTMIYLRLVGNDLKGATEELKIQLPDNISSGNVINLFKN